MLQPPAMHGRLLLLLLLLRTHFHLEPWWSWDALTRIIPEEEEAKLARANAVLFPSFLRLPCMPASLSLFLSLYSSSLGPSWEQMEEEDEKGSLFFHCVCVCVCARPSRTHTQGGGSCCPPASCCRRRCLLLLLLSLLFAERRGGPSSFRPPPPPTIAKRRSWMEEEGEGALL